MTKMIKTSSEVLSSRKLSTGRSILMLLALLTFVSFMVYIFAPNMMTQTIFIYAALASVIGLIVFAISKIGKKNW